MTMNGISSSKDNHPLVVEHCGACGLPPDMCIYFRNYGSCLEWLQNKHPDKYKNLLEENLRDLQSQPTPNKIKLQVDENVQYNVVGISEDVGKNGKCVTKITGLNKFGVDLIAASEYLKKTFCCKTSVKGKSNIFIYGSFKKQLYKLLPQQWKIDPFDIEDLNASTPK